MVSRLTLLKVLDAVKKIMVEIVGGDDGDW